MNPTDKKRFLKQLGAHIAKVRIKKGVSSSELARKTYSDTSLISRIERGRTNPTSVTLKMICDALEITMEELFKGFSRRQRKYDEPISTSSGIEEEQSQGNPFEAGEYPLT